MVCFVALFESAQNGDRVFHAGLADKNLLETTFQRSVFFNVFAVLIQRGGTNESQLTTSQHGLQHVGSRHRAFAATRTHQRVKLVNEGDDFPFGVVDFFQHSL